MTDRHCAGEWKSLPHPVSHIPKPSEGYMAVKQAVESQREQKFPDPQVKNGSS